MISVILFDVGICNSGWSQIFFILFGIIKEQSVIKIIGFLLQNIQWGKGSPKFSGFNSE